MGGDAACLQGGVERWRRWGVLAGVLLAAVLLRLILGSAGVGLPDGETLARVVFGHRVDRVVVGSVVGVALAVAGVALQTLLRNPLAEPFLLGLSTAAALGMVAQWWVADVMGWHLGAGYGGAMVGTLVCMAVVYVAGRRGGMLDPLALLLTGVVIGTINGAAIMLLVKLRPRLLRDDLANWMMGFLRVDISGWTLGVIAAMTAAGLAWMMMASRALDVATLPPAEATALGAHIPRLRRALFVVSGVLAAGAVVLAGPVAFVGLIAPHLARRLVGPGHAQLVPAAAVLGAVLVIAADTAGAACALVFHVGVIPLGVFTALIGGVSFLGMLRGGRAGWG
ncbi:MAG: iron ABC transporter permease [Algisphaera sp.]